MNAAQLRRAFIEYADTCRDLPPLRRTVRGRVLPQNDQPTDVRVAFCDFVDCANRCGNISDRVAQSSTL